MKWVHEGLILLGIFLILIGLIAYFYPVTYYIYFATYPYRDLGTIVILGGIICIALGAVYSPKKETIRNEGKAK